MALPIPTPHPCVPQRSGEKHWRETDQLGQRLRGWGQVIKCFILTGQTCEIDINECVKSPCRHGASCQNTNGSYRCLCQAGYTGRNCESDIDDCRPSTWYPALSILCLGASVPKHT